MGNTNTWDWRTDYEVALPEIQQRVERACVQFGLSAADTEEIVTDVQSTFWEQTPRAQGAGPEFPEPANTIAWAFTVARNMIHERNRRRARERAHYAAYAASRPVAAADPMPEGVEEILRLVDDPLLFQVLWLRHVEGQTLEVIAQAVGKSTSAVHYLCRNGYAELRKKLEL